MISRCESKCHATENPDEAVLYAPYRHSVLQESDAFSIDDKDQQSGTWFNVLWSEDEKLDDVIISDKIQQLKEPCSSFHDQGYDEKIKEFQSYVDMVKKIVRPGCSPETLNVALSSMSSLVKTLSVMSSKQYIHASL